MVETWKVMAVATLVLILVGIVSIVTGAGNSPAVLVYVPFLLVALYLGYWVGQRIHG